MVFQVFGNKCAALHQVDLIVAKSGLASCGYLRASHLLPCVGNNAFTDQDGICTELQLYSTHSSDLAVLQQRAPATLGRLVPPTIPYRAPYGALDMCPVSA